MMCGEWSYQIRIASCLRQSHHHGVDKRYEVVDFGVACSIRDKFLSVYLLLVYYFL